MADFGNGSQQNNRNRINIYSNGLVFFDEQGNMLKFTYLNEAISITFIFPIIEGDKKIYSNAPSENVVLSRERVAALFEVVIKKVLNAMNNNTPYNGGVFSTLKKDNVFEIRYENNEIYAVLHKNIDANRNPQNSYVFHFQKIPTIENFIPGGKEFEILNIDANFYLFVKMIEGFLYGIGNGIAHSVKCTENSTMFKLMRNIEGIAAKLGISYEMGSTANNGFSQQYSSTPQNSSMVPSQEVDTLSGLLY